MSLPILNKTTGHKVKRSVIALVIVLISPMIWATQAEHNSQITLMETATSFHYQSPPRLSTVLTEALHRLTYNPYALGASLIDEKQQPNFTLFQKSVMDRLAKHVTFSTEKIAAQLKQSHFAKREDLSLDNDIVRIFPKKNPLLEGQFKLYLPKRPNYILVYGAIQSNTPIRLTIKNGLPLQAYLPEIPFYNVAMNTVIWVIQPNQTIYRIQNIHREQQPTYLAPGAIIYVGSNEIPTPLNSDIVTLLQNRLEM